MEETDSPTESPLDNAFNLPIEIILLIFEWAVSVPSALHHNYGSYFDFIRSEFGQPQRAREASKHKLALCLVCKRWNLIARKIIFHQLHISSASQMEALRDALIRLPLEDRNSTKRLDLEWEREAGSMVFSSVPPETMLVFLEILALLPSLEILYLPISFDIRGTTYPRLISRYLPNLKRLKFAYWDRQRDVSPTPAFLTHPGLLSYHGFWSTGVEVVPEPPIYSASLTLLSLVLPGDLPPRLTFPALKCLGLAGLGPFHSGLLQFLDVHGPKLFALSLGTSSGPLTGGQLEKDILYRCPNLQELLLYDPACLGTLSQSYPTIIRLGINQQSPVGLLSGPLNDVLDLNHFPKIHTIRLTVIEYRSLPGEETKAMVAGYVSPRGSLRFEDALGIAIPVSTS